jgi:hypothetical protein
VLPLVLGALLVSTGDARATEAAAAPWSLSLQQRRALLRSYAPVILKMADEEGERIGQDWITNYDFDRDGWQLANNGENWSRELAGFVRDGRHPEWRIRPTLYTSIVEFMTGDRKSAVLLYHIYHAMDAKHTHDWERVEIRLDGVRGGPGSGERVRYVVLTRHKVSVGRSLPQQQPAFLETATGRHLLVWQAAQTGWFGARKGQLHFVEPGFAGLDRRGGDAALVEVDAEGEVAFHYVFVPRADDEAVSRLRAREIDACNAADLASGAARDAVEMRDVRRIGYELQDIADVFPYQWRVPGNGSWGEPTVNVLLERPLVDEEERVVVPAGWQAFRNGAADLRYGRDDVRGYIGKNAFWGTWLFDRDLWLLGNAMGRAGLEGRCRNNGQSVCGERHRWQHDFFAHDGERAVGGPGSEKGRWLNVGWHEEAAGGFDGRWEQLFPDQPDPDVATGRCSRPRRASRGPGSGASR